MRNLLSLLAMTLILSFLSGTALAQPGRAQRTNKDKITKLLNLTDEQKTKIESLKSAHMKEMIDLKSELQKAVLDKKEIIKKGNIDKKSFIASQEKITELVKKMSLNKANHQMDVYSLLSAEQKEITAKHPFLFQGPRHKFQHGRPMRPGCRMPTKGPRLECKAIKTP